MIWWKYLEKKCFHWFNCCSFFLRVCRLTGFRLPPPIVSTGARLTLWLLSDYAVSGQGFKAAYEGKSEIETYKQIHLCSSFFHTHIFISYFIFTFCSFWCLFVSLTVSFKLFKVLALLSCLCSSCCVSQWLLATLCYPCIELTYWWMLALACLLFVAWLY